MLAGLSEISKWCCLSERCKILNFEILLHDWKCIFLLKKFNNHFFLRILSFKFRSSRPEVFCKKGVIRNFAKFTRKHLCQSLVIKKVAGRRPATLLKKRPWHRSFRVNFVKFLRTPFFTEHLWWLLLQIMKT